MIRFGPMSIVLLLGAVQGLVVASVILFSRSNRDANRFLAGLIILLTLKLVPYIIGYAGFYDAYPWLDLAPFDLPLGIGPLAYLYYHRLLRNTLPARWGLHLLPLLLQVIVGTALFLQPMTFKNDYELGAASLVNRFEGALIILSITAYLSITLRILRDYQSGMANTYSDLYTSSIRFLKASYWLIAVTMGLFCVAIFFGRFVSPISYFQMFPLYLLLTAAVYALGLGAWRFAHVDLPSPLALAPEPTQDWKQAAVEIAAQFEGLELWRDPLLSLPTAAQKLGISEAKLSKAINTGLGKSFSEWVNGYRVKQVVARLKDPRETADVLEIAFASGFNSKASFNRWFKQLTGLTPSEVRSTSKSP